MDNKDLDDFAKDLDKIAATTALPILKRHCTNATLLVEGDLKEYPPATVANSPSNQRWYQRGYGPKWRTKAGEVHGRQTSERLGASWAHEIRQEGYSVVGVVGNNTSYLPYVQGEEQADFHAERGWPTIEGILEARGPEILAEADAATEEILRLLV